MKKLLSLFVLTMLLSVATPAIALAAKPLPGPTQLVGYDVSWPQCGKKLPSGQAFGIVGINGGNAANTNPCLAAQLSWASKSIGGTKQAPIQLYVNTANPGEVISQITTWPKNNIDKTGTTAPNPYGDCTGTNDLPCSWQYGWNRAVEDAVDRFAPAAQTAKINQATGAYTWWLDVETMNTWQAGSVDALSRNAATLEGMTAYLKLSGANVGLYSTAVQWGEIVGTTVSPASNLNTLPNWRPSGASLENAKANCTLSPLTSGGFISLTQYVQQNLDKNHSCL
jgi:hypothetical protein